MAILAGYELNEVVCQGFRTTTYRCRRISDNTNHLLKIPVDDYPAPRELSQLKQEHTLTSRQDLPGVLRSKEFINLRNGLALLQEDFRGVSLKQRLGGRPLELGLFLRIAIRLAATLEGLHRHSIIHNGIHPGSILIATDDSEMRLTDFGRASQLLSENPRAHPLGMLEGELAYISPEQTGRMNRPVDYRTDLYSLGVTLYEMLTGTLPFTATDPLEWAHCHIAKQPESPLLRLRSVPEALCNILLKLLAKGAEDRYQSASGLHADLVHCLDQWETTGTILPFPPGRHDIPDRFHLPQKVYGREKEVAELLQAFDSAASGRALLMLVAGYSGVGKSSLVHEVHRPIMERRGYFASGKFDQFNRDRPYSALLQAFQSLVRQLLTEGDQQVALWRQRLLDIIGGIGQVIINVIPEVEFIIGPQPALPDLPPKEAQNRFHLAMQSFVRVFTRPERPVVLFLDDLQWADGASLSLLRSLCTEPGQRHLFIIGAYRDNEVEPMHPLMLAVKDIQQSEGEVRLIELAPLPASAVHQLTADTLYCDVEQVRPLAELVLARTQGNPFFLNEFLKTLAKGGLLAFDAAQQAWTWDLPRIRTLDITDNVADLMFHKVEELAPAARELLKRAACIDNRFDLRTLSVAAEQTVLEIGRVLLDAVQAGVILPLDETYRLFNLGAIHLPAGVNAEYKFAHDQLQQAAYALIPPSERPPLHWQIGGRLLRHLSPAEQDRQLFTLVNQLNQGRAYAADLEKRRELVELNLRAGRKAKASSAFSPALHYLQTGLALLGDAGWTAHYNLTLALHIEAAEAAYVNTSFEEMTRLAEGALRNARTILDKVKVYEIQIRSLVALSQLPQAVHTAMAALDMLGVRFPKRPGKTHVLLGLLRAKSALTGKRLEDLANMPKMTDPTKRAVLRILVTVSSASFVVAPEFFQLIVFKQVELTARYGNSAESCCAYALYAVALCSVLGDVESGTRFGELALQLLERFDAREFKAMVWMSVWHFIKPWKEPIQATLAPLLQAYQASLETGNLEFSVNLAHVYCISLYAAGAELPAVSQEIAAFTQTTSRLEQERGQHWISLLRQAVHNLLGETAEPWRLSGNYYEEEQMFPLHLKAANINTLAIFYLHKLVLNYLFRRYNEALESSARLEHYLSGISGEYYTAIYCFYDCLTRLALLPSAAPSPQRHHQKRIAVNQQRLRKWAATAPANFLHKVALVEAERARVRGDLHTARELYDQAITAALKTSYQNEEALARELAGDFYLSIGQHEMGQYHLSRAHHTYQRWGARAKVRHLEACYPSLLSVQKARFASAASTPATPTLDLLSVTKASQTISEEIVLERLLKKMMDIILENAGAQKGFLFLHKAGKLVLEAEAAVDKGEATVLKSIPIDACSRMAISIVNYVARAREIIVLDDATREGLFATDPYIVQARPLSVLCMPLVHQGTVTGLLYLENSHTAGAFTPDRQEVLRLLSAQIAISIEHAQLYTELERKVEERTQELKQKNIDLQAALQHLKETQAQLIQQEKLASLGHLTAGVAHEIKNPLNFVNNFAQHTSELLDELEQRTSNNSKLTVAEVDELLTDLRISAEKIYEHGQRADGIVRSMLEHSRASHGELRLTNLNALVEQYVNLVYQSTTVSTPSFVCNLVRDYDVAVLELALVPQEIGRVLINLLNNAFYAVSEQKKRNKDQTPQVMVRTRRLGDVFEIRIEDNGAGIPAHLRQRIFEPFFTTKPPGQGTGLGLSLSYDIITNGYGGTLEEQGREGTGAAFVIRLPAGRSATPTVLAED